IRVLLGLLLSVPVIAAIQCCAAAEDFFDTNRVMAVEIQIAPADWNVLRYQHRESDFFPEESNKAFTNPYTWFPARVIVDGHRFTTAKVRKKGYIGSNDTKRPGLKVQLEGSRPDESKESSLELTLNNNHQDPSLIRQFL